MRSISRLSLMLVLGLIASQDVFAQRSDRLTVADFLEWERVNDPQMSPDGSQIVFTRQWVDKMNDRWKSALWIMGSDGTRTRFLIDGSSARWSPDGSRIAFLAEGEPNGTQIFVRWMDGEGSVTQVTRVEHSPSNIQWSPDGSQIAFQMRVAAEQTAADNWRIDLPRPDGAEWTESPRIVERVIYRQDRVGFLEEEYQHLFVVPADGGSPRQLTDGDWNHGAPSWTPDGQALVFQSLRVPDWEYQWREAEIYAVDVNSGVMHQLTDRAGPDRSPVVSPDGRYIAYTGYDETTDDYVEDTLYIMNLDGSGSRALTTALDRTPRRVHWAPDGSGVYFTAQNEGSENLYYAPVNGAFRQVTNAPHLFRLTGVSDNGVAIGTRSSPQHPADVVTFEVRRPEDIRQLTDVNGDVLAGKLLGEVEELWYTSFDGQRTQGWIVKPPDFDPRRKYPLILSIHGGPHSMYTVGFSFPWQEHAANGYVLLYTNPRGSSGYGSEFGNAIQFNYPGDDFHDLMAGVDSVVGRGYIDEQNMYVYGCSGGGVLTAWTVGHTDRFAAAASLCPVIDWVSFVGNVDGNFLRWYADFEHFPWEDPTEHLRRSPLMYIDNVTTPTLLMTGVQDMRTPISQTEEFYQALKAVKVPTAMIRMNKEWHGTSRTPSNFIRTQLYLRRWFERWGGMTPSTEDR